MTTPKPVQAYAAVSPDGTIDANFVCAEKDGIQSYWENIPVTILPTEQYEAMVEAVRGVEFTYTNWRGETSKRRVLPVRFWFGSTKWHKERQRMMTAFDLDKGEMRDFAVDDIDWQNNAALDRALAAMKEQNHG